MEKDFYPLIFRFFDFNTTINSMTVNKFYYKLAKSNLLWSKLCLENEFPTDIDPNQYINYKKCHIISKWCVDVVGVLIPVGTCFFSGIFLNLSYNNLTSIPPELGILSKLERLNLNNNHLTSIPPELGKLSNLKELTLNDNKLTSIPPEVGNLSNLIELSFHNNKLTSIPPELGNLSNLKILYLSYNNLTSIPPELGNLSNLKQLWLNNNKLTSIPPELGINLETLYLTTMI